MSLLSSIGKAVGGLVKTSVGLTAGLIKAPMQLASGVLNGIFGNNQQQCGHPHGPSIFGCGPRPMGPPPLDFYHEPMGFHGHHHHGPHMPPPPPQGGIHFHFDS